MRYSTHLESNGILKELQVRMPKCHFSLQGAGPQTVSCCGEVGVLHSGSSKAAGHHIMWRLCVQGINVILSGHSSFKSRCLHNYTDHNPFSSQSTSWKRDLCSIPWTRRVLPVSGYRWQRPSWRIQVCSTLPGILQCVYISI